MSRVIKIQNATGKEDKKNAEGGGRRFMPFNSLWTNGVDGVVLDPGKIKRQELDTDRLKAERQLSDAKAAAEKIRSDAYQEGLDKGLAEGRGLGHAEYEEAIARLRSMLSDLNDKCNKINQRFDADILKLVKVLVDRLVSHEVSVNPRVIEATLAKALHFVVENTTVRVSLHPNDFNRFKESGLENPALFEGRSRVQIIEDLSIQEGGCLLATDFGEIDATLENRRNLLFQAIDEAFLISLAEDVPDESAAGRA